MGWEAADTLDRGDRDGDLRAGALAPHHLSSSAAAGDCRCRIMEHARPPGAAASRCRRSSSVLRERRILLTGATGFLGKTFLDVLLRHHPEIERIYLLIRGDQRSQPEPLPARSARFAGDGSAARASGRTLRALRRGPRWRWCPAISPRRGWSPMASSRSARTIDAVVHCAGLVNFEASLEKALVGQHHWASPMSSNSAASSDAALLHVSTCYVAGGADGHRYEDDLPIDWCPNGRHGISTCSARFATRCAAVARIEAESREQAHSRRVPGTAATTASDAGAPGPDREPAQALGRGALKQVGRERAQSWGWPNTYSYTKSLGEQLVLAARDELDVDGGAALGYRERAQRSVAGLEPGRQHQRAADLSFRPRLPLLSRRSATWCWT